MMRQGKLSRRFLVDDAIESINTRAAHVDHPLHMASAKRGALLYA